MLTKNGIYTNINESTYFCEFFGLRFYFTSEVYLKKFRDNLINFINNESEKLNNKYKIKVNLFLTDINTFLSISLYGSIEKRGFKIIDINKSLELKR